MLKTILIALDPSESGLQAQHYSLKLAKRFKAKITALGIIDTPWITAAQPEPLGGSSFKINRDDMLIHQSHNYVQHMINDFKQICSESHIDLKTIEVEGFPAILIERMAQEHDLVIMGKTADFHCDLDESSDYTVKHVARDNPRPLVVIPYQTINSGHILVTLDGSVAAARALHMFLLLGLANDHNIEVLSIHKESELAQHIATRGVRMCQAHGIQASSHIIADHGHEAERILEYANDMRSQMIVMGGFSHSGIKQALFGSCSQYILQHSTIPLFMYH